MTEPQPVFSETDIHHMRRALRLAGLGREAAPNPMVGCVLTDARGAKVGEGFHLRPGAPHAEIVALNAADCRTHGGTAYVTLEPCSFHGRTPPCADALIAAGLRRIVIAMVDPDERVRGRGAEKLIAARLEVQVGLLDAEARRLNRAYIKHRTSGMPCVVLKTAMTLDGRVATTIGDSRWITSPQSRLWVHRRLRSRLPAIMVGVETVLADDPALTVRLAHRPDARNPLRVVVDSHLRTPVVSRIVEFGARDGLTLVAHVDDPNRRGPLLVDAGAKLLACSADTSGRVDVRRLLARLGSEMAVTGVLVEGGPTLSAALLGEHLVDEYICMIGAVLVGGSSAPGPVGGPGLAATMAEAVKGTGLRVRRSAGDVILSCDLGGMV